MFPIVFLISCPTPEVDFLLCLYKICRYEAYIADARPRAEKGQC
jgi:hypothetical protein